MKPFRRFYFDRYEFDFDTLEAKFFYNFDNKEFFEEVVSFKSNVFKLNKNIDKGVINNILFHIHMALGISYYKLYPTKELLVHSWYLDEQAMVFWIKFYKNWLWEFLYKNEISPKKLFNFMNMSGEPHEKVDFDLKNRSLIALWWWKDSLVSIELFEKANLKFNTVVFWKFDKIKKRVSDKIGKKNLFIERKLSENLFKLNDEWYYNWHIPITGITSFILVLAAYLYDYKYIVMSNEKSANIPNTVWKKLDINHQYSKSLEYEIDFDNYIKTFVWTKIKYFSLLRWMYEFKIAKLFSKLAKDYFNIFSSCNNNFKIKPLDSADTKIVEGENTGFSKVILWDKLWCNSCPKCVFVFVILSAFLSSKKLIEIFWEDLYERGDLEELFKELFGISWIKPFECVWDKEELILSAKMALDNYKGDLPYNLYLLKRDVLDKMSSEDFEKLETKLNRISKEDIIPEELREKIKVLN